MSTKKFAVCFSFCLDLELFAKIKKTGFYTLDFYTFINNSRSKQNKKNPNTLLQTLLSRKGVQNFSKNSEVFGARQSF